MPSHKIDELIWRAFTDDGFRAGLLNGHRGELASQLGLSEVERRAVMAVRADTLEDFAGALSQPAYCSA
jgi:hypothetical protein